MPRVEIAALRAGLVELAGENWRKDSLCIEYPEVDWFPAKGEPNDAARTICARCLVQAECLTFALSAPETRYHGIWAGTTPQERREMVKAA